MVVSSFMLIPETGVLVDATYRCFPGIPCAITVMWISCVVRGSKRNCSFPCWWFHCFPPAIQFAVTCEHGFRGWWVLLLHRLYWKLFAPRRKDIQFMPSFRQKCKKELCLALSANIWFSRSFVHSLACKLLSIVSVGLGMVPTWSLPEIDKISSLFG